VKEVAPRYDLLVLSYHGDSEFNLRPNPDKQAFFRALVRNLCRALGLTTARHSRQDLGRGPVWIEEWPPRVGRIVRTPRVGVDHAGAWARRPWRFALAGNPWVSSRRIPLRQGSERAITSRE
jgi:hypothetical protein